ncbi:hypothetical protein O181_038803 [Austropuccinia psidii MF-1]|uniref:Reverse transcriptase/retrotransposon-derived protein RNase H-like domain-containing protein n=1 Tax=Austropuccinia psidii MF-1 TaxID=1389203 RepID=A0A9Q3HBC4_9BASI|nr:hypothetical protein [Austropuccinia psidii MF-1]
MDHQVLEAKYKSVLKKVRLVNEPMPQELNSPLEIPPLSRDPYEIPLSTEPPVFKETFKVTHERPQAVGFWPTRMVKNEEINLLKNVNNLREKIPVIPHEPLQRKPIPIPKSILPQFTELITERIRTGLYEKYTSSYTSPISCVSKSNGKLRIVHDLQELHKFTIKDSGLSPQIEEFVDAFAGRAFYGLGAIMAGYDERELDVITRPLTTFETPFGRIQLTRLPQGATNSVAVYQAQMTWILQEEIPESVVIFIDDGGIKGLRSLYNQETLPENPSIRRFIWEYSITLERILFMIEEAGLTISESKFSFCVPALDIEIRGFLALCAYVRIFIENFSQVASPIRRLTREDADWDWDQKCEEAFHKLRRIVGEEITLKKLNYDKGAGRIKIAVDSSYISAGEVLTQEDKEGKDRPVLYESIKFSKLESKYSQPKLELCGVARIFKKLQKIIWGQHLELKVESKSLIEMINTPFLPHAPMRRWVAFIKLFSFDLVHKPGKNFTITDGISRRPKNSEYEDEYAPEFDEEENWIKPHPGFRAKNVNSLTFSGK